MKKLQTKKGFTIIELLMVFAILTVIASIILVAIGETRAKSRDAKRKLEMSSLQKGLELYYDDEGKYPEVTDWIRVEADEVKANAFVASMEPYIKKRLHDPLYGDGTSDYSYRYSSEFTDGAGYKACVLPETLNSVPVDDPDYPYYCVGSGTGENIAVMGGGEGGGAFWVCGDPIDYEGGPYGTVRMGEQCWTRNLNVGARIDCSNSQTNNSTIEKWCSINDGGLCASEGGFYQWNEAMQYTTATGAQGICPGGWHIPTYNEWTILERFVCPASDSVCESRFPITEIAGWYGQEEGLKLRGSPFSAVCAGSCDSSSHGVGYFWTSLNGDGGAVDWAWLRKLDTSNYKIHRGQEQKAGGYSVRCIEDF